MPPMRHHVNQLTAMRKQLFTIVVLSELLKDAAPTAGIWISYQKIRAAAFAMDSILADHEREAAQTGS
jgi:hypothetical protein